MPRSGFNVDDIKEMKRYTVDHETFRKHCQSLKGSTMPPDNKWMSSLKQSSLLALRIRIIEANRCESVENTMKKYIFKTCEFMCSKDLLYGTALNGAISAVMKKSKSQHPLDLLEMEAFDMRWKEACNRKDEEQSAECALQEASGGQNSEQPQDDESLGFKNHSFNSKLLKKDSTLLLFHFHINYYLGTPRSPRVQFAQHQANTNPARRSILQQQQRKCFPFIVHWHLSLIHKQH